MRTPQEALRDALPAIQAAAEGRPIEWRLLDKGHWKDVNDKSVCQFADPTLIWRIKPEPKRTLRPWSHQEVPLGAILRYKDNMRSVKMLIVCNCENGLTGNGSHWPFGDLAAMCEHSTDGGKTWHPCGVWEEEIQ